MARRCPLCGAIGEAPLCARDGMATLLAGAPTSDARRVTPGLVIAGRYRIQRTLGQGAFGTVFQAEHAGTGQAVAIKVLSVGEQDVSVALARFFLEARATSGLHHPNTVRVFDFGQDDSGLIYLAMELLRGKTLKTEITERGKRGQVFRENEAAEIAVAITKSLGEAHAAGLVHRDLKPENIFLQELPGDERVIKVLDFGIAKVLGVALTASGQAAALGSPAYMSPEQAESRNVDARSDLYSLGVILFQMLSGRLPFVGKTAFAILEGHLGAPVPDPRPFASEPFARLIEKAMAKAPDRRFKDAAEMRAALVALPAYGV